MKPARKRKLGFILLMLVVLSVVLSLVLYALRQNISLFYTPSQIALGQAVKGQMIHAGGMVVKGSVIRDLGDMTVHFKLTDYKQVLDVTYTGILPDLFREEQGIVAHGILLDNQHFKAITVLAKHDEKYMPPEVRDALSEMKSK